jgi:hypothetical protein
MNTRLARSQHRINRDNDGTEGAPLLGECHYAVQKLSQLIDSPKLLKTSMDKTKATRQR